MRNRFIGGSKVGGNDKGLILFHFNGSKSSEDYKDYINVSISPDTRASISYPEGKFGYCLRNSSSVYPSCSICDYGSPSQLTELARSFLGDFKFSIDYWLYLDSNSSSFDIILFPTSDSWNTYSMVINYDSSDKCYGVYMEDYQGSTDITLLYDRKDSGSISSGEWYHVAFQFSSTYASTYINGVRTNYSTGDFKLSDNAMVGTYEIDLKLYNCRIDEFRICLGETYKGDRFTVPSSPYS